MVLELDFQPSCYLPSGLLPLIHSRSTIPSFLLVPPTGSSSWFSQRPPVHYSASVSQSPRSSDQFLVLVQSVSSRTLLSQCLPGPTVCSFGCMLIVSSYFLSSSVVGLSTIELTLKNVHHHQLPPFTGLGPGPPSGSGQKGDSVHAKNSYSDQIYLADAILDNNIL